MYEWKNVYNHLDADKLVAKKAKVRFYIKFISFISFLWRWEVDLIVSCRSVAPLSVPFPLRKHFICKHHITKNHQTLSVSLLASFDEHQYRPWAHICAEKQWISDNEQRFVLHSGLERKQHTYTPARPLYDTGRTVTAYWVYVDINMYV